MLIEPSSLVYPSYYSFHCLFVFYIHSSFEFFFIRNLQVLYVLVLFGLVVQGEFSDESAQTIGK